MEKKLNLYIDDQDGRELFYYKILTYDPEIKLTKFLIKNLNKKEIFYDIGASYGFYSLIVLHLLKTGEIHIFEPNPKIYTCLKTTFSSFNHIHMNNKAVSNQSNNMKLSFDPHGSTGGTIQPIPPGKDDEIVEIQTSTLDQYVHDHNIPTLIKIDVEGVEGDVIEGGKKLMDRHRPTIIMELYGCRNPEAIKSYHRALNILGNIGYEPFEILNNGELKKTNLII